jgi:hypothetical protein
MLAKGEAFVREHPFSMFGDDNVKAFNVVKAVMAKYRSGVSVPDLYDWIRDEYGRVLFDDDDEAEDERGENEDLQHAEEAFDWLTGEIEEIY